MLVEGQEIGGTAREHAAAYRATLTKGDRFKAAGLRAWAVVIGVCPPEVSVRFADRVLYAGRKADLRRFSGQLNRWVAR